MNRPNRGLLLFYGFWVLAKTEESELGYEVVISCIIGEGKMDGRLALSWNSERSLFIFAGHYEGGVSTCQPTLLGHGGQMMREQSKQIQPHVF